MVRHITLPLDRETARSLHAGDEVLLTGVIYTARDAAHKRLYEMLQNGETLPLELNGITIYYAGPTAAPPGRASGSIGPTTSSRMDAYTPDLLKLGVAGIIGKGPRSEKVAEAFVSAGAVYFAATGGAGALLSECVKHSQVVAFPELGAEAVRRLDVENFPVLVALDSGGCDLYKSGRLSYLNSLSDGKQL